MTKHEQMAREILNQIGQLMMQDDEASALIVIRRALAQAEAEPHADEDGDCSRCGLSWQESKDDGDHVCPPGFWTPRERALAAEKDAEIARLKAENLRLSHEGLLVEKQAAEAERDYFMRELDAEIAKAEKEKAPA